MNFVSCLKTVSMRIDVETLPFLMTDSDIPILRVAMAYTAHEEALLRTQARNAASTFFEDEDGRGTAVADCLGNGKVQEAWLSYWQVMTFDMTCHAPVLD